MNSFFETVPQPQQRGFKTLQEQMAELRAASANPVQRIRTGMRQLDRAIRGVGAGELLMFAARSGNGKSAFATQFIANNPDTPTIFFSLEMPASRVMQRLFCQVTDHPAADLEEAAMKNQLPADLERIQEKLPFAVVIDKPGLGWEDMRAMIETYEEFYSRRPAVVLIDYLELVAGMKSKGEITSAAVDAIANQAKEFAVEQNLGVVMLHQLNTSVKEWEPPNKSSLRYGGLAESDFVVGLWRPGLDPDRKVTSSNQEREVGINVIKNRIFGDEPRHLRYTLSHSLQFVDLGPR